MTTITRYDFSDEEQITAKKSDEIDNYLWIAYAQNSDGYCVLKKQSFLNLNQNFYTLNRYVSEIKAIDLDASQVYVAYDDVTLLGEIFSKSNPLTVTIEITNPENEAPVDVKSDGSYVYFLLPGLISGENAKVLKYDTSGIYQTTIELPGITNATSMVLKQTLIDGIPSDANTHLLLQCNGADGSTSFTDIGITGHTVTAVGNALIQTAHYVFGTGSCLFDGTGDYLSVPDSIDWDLGSGDFTYDFRVRFNSVSGNQGFFGRFTSAGSHFYIAKEGNSIRIRDFGGTLDKIVTWTPVVNTWYHIAIVRNGNDIKIFVDGTQVGTTTTFSGALVDRSVPLFIGTAFSDSYFLNGWMDDIRFSQGFARWTTDFTIPYGISQDLWIVTYESPVKLIQAFESFTNVYGFQSTDIV